MCRSMVFIETPKEVEMNVARDLLFHEGVVKEVRSGVGPYNLIAEIETDTPEKLTLFLQEQVQPNPNVLRSDPVILNLK